MTLRKKTILSISIAFLCMIVIFVFIARFILLENLKDIEEDNTHKSVERVLAAYSYALSDMESTTAVWASWDDTYAFVEDGNSAYIDTNLSDGTFTNLRLHLMLFINSSGKT